MAYLFISNSKSGPMLFRAGGGIVTYYVYELIDEAGSVQYVGKGSGRRLQTQKRKFGLAGRVIEWFKSEKAAYAYEVKAIAEKCPPLNKAKGGNGSRAQKIIRRRLAWELEMERIGTRAYAARLLMKFCLFTDASKLEAVRRVAYGQGS
jgi:hypothetical protein